MSNQFVLFFTVLLLADTLTAARRRVLKLIRSAAVLFAFASLSALPASAAWILFDDGARHIIGHDAFAFDNVEVIDGPSSPTSLDIILGAEIGGTVRVFGTSEVNFSGGITGVAVPGGGGDLQSHDFALATLSGGTVSFNLVGRGNSTILVSGGVIGNEIHAQDDSLVIVDRTGFNYPYGQIEESIGFLTGVLRDGTPLANQFFRHPGARLVLIPEPSTIILFGLGLAGLAFLGRRSSSRRTLFKDRSITMVTLGYCLEFAWVAREAPRGCGLGYEARLDPVPLALLRRRQVRNRLGITKTEIAWRPLLLAMMLTANPLPASAYPILDQAQHVEDSLSSVVYHNQDAAQTVTVGLSGKLVRIEVLVRRLTGNGSTPILLDDLRLDVRRTAGSLPTGDDLAVLGTSAILRSDVQTSSAAWVGADLADVSVQEGDKLAIVLRSDSLSNWWGFVWSGSASSDSYSRGDRFLRTSTDPVSWEVVGGDMTFRTYVIPVPEPATWMLLLMGVALGRKRWT